MSRTGSEMGMTLRDFATASIERFLPENVHREPAAAQDRRLRNSQALPGDRRRASCWNVRSFCWVVFLSPSAVLAGARS